MTDEITKLVASVREAEEDMTEDRLAYEAGDADDEDCELSRAAFESVASRSALSLCDAIEELQRENAELRAKCAAQIDRKWM